MYSDVPWDSPTPPPNSTANEEIQPCQNSEVERESDTDRERLSDDMRAREKDRNTWADKQIAKGKMQKKENNSGDSIGLKGVQHTTV